MSAQVLRWTVAAVIREHRYQDSRMATAATCSCGRWNHVDGPEPLHADHVASEVVAILATTGRDQ